MRLSLPGKLGVVTATVMVSGAFAACGTQQAKESQATTARAAAATDNGKELYDANCAKCHGEDLKGTDEGPPFIDKVYVPGHHADESFQFAVANGVRAHHWGFGDMPPITGLSREEVAEIVSYVRGVQVDNGIK